MDGVESLFFFQGRADWLDRVAMYELPRRRPGRGGVRHAPGGVRRLRPAPSPAPQAQALAVARAPLGERIGVLRQLATLDPANPVWPEDIATFEAAPIEQVRHELARAKASGDATALRRLCDELSDPRWTIAVQPNVSSEARRMLSRIRTDEVRAEMIKVEAELGESHSALDHERREDCAGSLDGPPGERRISPRRRAARAGRARTRLGAPRGSGGHGRKRIPVRGRGPRTTNRRRCPRKRSGADLTRRLCGSNMGYPGRARPLPRPAPRDRGRGIPPPTLGPDRVGDGGFPRRRPAGLDVPPTRAIALGRPACDRDHQGIDAGHIEEAAEVEREAVGTIRASWTGPRPRRRGPGWLGR